MAKEIKHGQQCQAEIIEGVKKAVGAIKTTLGPAGKHVAIQTPYGTEISRDGATVAQSISFKNPSMNIGAELVRKAAKLTEDSVGDSTSSTSILINEFCQRGQKAISTGANVNEIKSGMMKARDWVKDFIVQESIPINGNLESVRKVATVSANNDPSVGDLVVDCMEKVGMDGVITADLSAGLETYTIVTEGMKLERGWSSPQYVTTPEDGLCTLNEPLVLVVGETITSVNQVIDIVGKITEQKRPFLIICDDIMENVNMTFVMNTLQGAIRCCIVKGLDFGDGRKNLMEDVATVVGATHLCPENGRLVKDAALSDLGGANKIVISRDSCIIYNGYGDQDKIQARTEILKKRLEDPGITEYDKMKFGKRIAGLAGGIAVIYAGGATETEKMNLKATIEDSILAAKSAISEGYVTGGGYVYLKAAYKIKEDIEFWNKMSEGEREGAKIIVSSLSCITRTIVENSGDSSDVIINDLESKFQNQSSLEADWGYNAKTKKNGYLVNEGVLDSAKGLRVSLENSVSTASMILLIDCVLLEEEVEKLDPKHNNT